MRIKVPTKSLFVMLFLSMLATLPLAARPHVELGIDILAAHDFHGLEGKRVGLITNPSGVSNSGRSTLDILRSAPNLKLVALFAPEHGVYGSELAGAYVAQTRDTRTGLPVYSLYGPTRKPTPAMLKDIDVLIYDIQDIGCRSYTFISTLGLAMEAAGEAGIEFYVLDRPNPLNGNRVEGPPLDPRFRSFVGQWNIPYVYGLTPGELASMINTQKWISKSPKQLVIVPMRGWRRDMYWEDTGLLWVPTSPHIPTAQSAIDYTITGLLGDAGGVSHGIGYTLPFELVGSPNFNAFVVSDDLNAAHLPGVFFRPAFYKPFYGGFKDQVCQGAQIHLINRDLVNLTNLSMFLLDKMQKFTQGALFKRISAEDLQLFDKLYGSDLLRKQILAGRPAMDLIPGWKPSLDAFRKLRKPYLIYSDTGEAAPSHPAESYSKPRPASKF